MLLHNYYHYSFETADTHIFIQFALECIKKNTHTHIIYKFKYLY